MTYTPYERFGKKDGCPAHKGDRHHGTLMRREKRVTAPSASAKRHGVATPIEYYIDHVSCECGEKYSGEWMDSGI